MGVHRLTPTCAFRRQDLRRHHRYKRSECSSFTMKPGSTALTRMPMKPACIAKYRVMFSKPAFAAW